ncbi:hypothetical protein FHS14_005128 [Paenibacillus baekrokdamisoli]|nr:IS66 family transposase [Paenibacillus baekrokdamisoli]MBB3072113.1 hypothetical protein [Paenibacillus baekrokdamisoli]
MPPAAEKSDSVAQQGMNFCNQVYAIERDLKEATPKKRHDVRQERSRPVLDAYLAWLKQQRGRTLPKSTTGKAIAYSLNQWDKLTLQHTTAGRRVWWIVIYYRSLFCQSNTSASPII